MKYIAVIEIPKGCDRRIHMRYDGSGFEDFGPIKEKIPINDGVMPVHYGYMKDYMNHGVEEKDHVDAIIFSNARYKTGDEVEVEIIGLLERDDNDDKIISVDNTMPYRNFLEVPEDERRLILSYFGYGHNKLEVKDATEAERYLK